MAAAITPLPPQVQIYLVGGAVRDRLLDIPPQDRDWVVVGATPAQMVAAGYRPVGRDFPVFLHPETQEEYALARTERKAGRGYHGFVCDADPSVTLVQDLQRRDLTINAMAEMADGTLIDPFGGRDDLAAGRLRHVSPAFAEDPVRILRLARYAARYGRWGFRVSHETHHLAQQMVTAGEVDALVPERVWQELVRALAEPTPSRCIKVLRRCGALARLLPEVDRLFGVPQPPHHHPEVDTGEHLLLVLDQAAALSEGDSEVVFAALLHDLGKGSTPPSEWPRHHGHEQRGVADVEAICERLRVPNSYRDLARLVTRYHGHYHRAAELRPATLLDTLEALDALRRPERLAKFLLACEADSRGRPGYQTRDFAQPAIIRAAHAAASSITAAPLLAAGVQGRAIGEQLRQQRIAAIATAVAAWQTAPTATTASGVL